MGAALSRARTVLSRDEYLARWSALHGGYDPAGSFFVGPYLRLVYACARPFARVGAPPDVVTLLGLLVSGAAVVAAALGADGGWWLGLAVALVVLSALLDGLDGGVAVVGGRSTPFGYVLDSVVDRCSDLLYVLALLVVGAPAWLCATGAALMMLQEYVRARAAAGGLTDVGVVTVWERPTRVVVTATFLLGAALYGSSASGWATAGAMAWTTLGVVGLGQLLVVVRRRLRAPG